jgi:hypothetical protein
MRVMSLRRPAVVAVSLGMALIQGTASAQISVYRQWRVVYHVNLKVRNYWWGGALVAPSRDQAWAIGYTVRAGRISGDFLEHWNGQRWRMTAVPGINLMPDSVAASSPDNVWLFSNANRAFVWDGQRWAPAQGTRGMSMNDPVVLGPSDVWTIGGGICGSTTLDHWTGSSWTMYTVRGGLEAMSGSSPGNFWILRQPLISKTGTCTVVRGSPLAALRWDGSSFKRVRIPRVINGNHAGHIVVASAHDIWIATSGEDTIVHWNGHRWTRLNERAADGGFIPGQIMPDGRGGAWIGGCWHWLGGIWHPIDYFRDTCDETFGLARIPGSRSAWRLGIYTFGSHEEGTIEVNGPLP